MADVRALLRQQRAARRIEHPHASYTDSGKLMCTACREYIKTETLWDGHLRSASHRQRLQSLHQSSGKQANGYAGFVDQTVSRKGDFAPPNKRKLSDSDEEMPDRNDEQTARRKRTKAETALSDEPTTKPDDPPKQGKPLTPPLTSRASGTPTFGVEIQIPSRPATPSASRESASSGSGTPMAMTPKAAPVGRSPLIPDEQQSTASQSAQQPPPPTSSSGATTTAATTTSAAAPVDEDEWAAFEAEMIHGTATAPAGGKPAAAAAALDNNSSSSDAVISAPAMSAAEVAAKSEEEERAKRRALADIQLEDEKEEATRALEAEFEVMEELEARARRLRERREALRLQNGGGGGGGGGGSAAGDDGKGASAPGKENAAAGEEEEDDDEDDDEEDDWDGFRFRA